MISHRRWSQMYTLKIKKISDALLKSDARADQNQVIFFTWPYQFMISLKIAEKPNKL